MKQLVVKPEKCIGCRTCELVCSFGHYEQFSPRLANITVLEYEAATLAVPVVCQQCEEASCMKVCPVRAITRDENGACVINYDKCIGCRMCMSACPYTGVRSFNWEEPQYHMDYAVGGKDVPVHQKHVVEKCTFCYHRISKGEEPACMHLCVGRARHWGDLDDPNSEVSQLIRDREYKQLLPERGTDPSVYYLV